MIEREIKSLRFYLVLPLLAVPFITLTFWVMGGGKVQPDDTARRTGLNMALPDVRNVSDSGRDKMSYYEMASADSAKRSELMRNDPNFPVKRSEPAREVYPTRITTQAIHDRIPVPLDAEPKQAVVERYSTERALPLAHPPMDPELEAINQTIEKLAALQNAPKMAVKAASAEMNPEVYSVSASTEKDESFFGRKTSTSREHPFWEDNAGVAKSGRSFLAVVPTEQVLETGSELSLRLRESIRIAGVVIPSGTSLHGLVSFENERMYVQIPSIRFGHFIYPVAMTVFDMDGIEGIHIPGSASRDVIKSTAEQSLQSVNVVSLDPSVKSQAVTAGIGAAKNLLGKKVKAVRAIITAGYEVLLRDSKAN